MLIVVFFKRANIEFPIGKDNYFLSFKNAVIFKIKNPNSKVYFHFGIWIKLHLILT